MIFFKILAKSSTRAAILSAIKNATKLFHDDDVATQTDKENKNSRYF